MFALIVLITSLLKRQIAKKRILKKFKDCLNLNLSSFMPYQLDCNHLAKFKLKLTIDLISSIVKSFVKYQILRNFRNSKTR